MRTREPPPRRRGVRYVSTTSVQAVVGCAHMVPTVCQASARSATASAPISPRLRGDRPLRCTAAHSTSSSRGSSGGGRSRRGHDRAAGLCRARATGKVRAVHGEPAVQDRPVFQATVGALHVVGVLVGDDTVDEQLQVLAQVGRRQHDERGEVVDQQLHRRLIDRAVTEVAVRTPRVGRVDPSGERLAEDAIGIEHRRRHGRARPSARPGQRGRAWPVRRTDVGGRRARRSRHAEHDDQTEPPRSDHARPRVTHLQRYPQHS